MTRIEQMIMQGPAIFFPGGHFLFCLCELRVRFLLALFELGHDLLRCAIIQRRYFIEPCDPPWSPQFAKLSSRTVFQKMFCLFQNKWLPLFPTASTEDEKKKCFRVAELRSFGGKHPQTHLPCGSRIGSYALGVTMIEVNEVQLQTTSTKRCDGRAVNYSPY